MTTLSTRRPAVTLLPRVGMPELAEEPPRVMIGRAAREGRAVLGAAAAGVAVGFGIGPVLGLVSLGWVPVVAYVWFVLTYTALVSLEEDGPAVRDRFTGVLMWSAAGAVVAFLALVVGYVLFKGERVFASVDLSDWRHNFLTTDMSLAGPLAPIDTGGISFAIVGTLEQIAIALVITVPLGIATAVFLNEVGGRYARLVRTVVEAMTALPSVVAGLFIYASVILLFTKHYSGFAAALAISVLMLPIMIRSADVVLRLVPGNLREAGLALGAGQWSVVRRIVLPTVRSGLTTAIILGTAHGIGETAPALLTSGVTSNTNWNAFSANPQTPLPLAALEFIKSGQPNLVPRGFATAAVLLVLVLVLFVTARLIGGQQAGQVTDAQRRRLTARSIRQLPRIAGNHAWVAEQLGDRSPAAGDAQPGPGRRRALDVTLPRTFVTAPVFIPLQRAEIDPTPGDPS